MHLFFQKNIGIFIYLCLAHLAVDFMIGIWPVYKTLVKFDIAQAGLFVGLCVLVGEGMQVIFGSLADRGYHKILLLGGLLGTICSTLYPYAQSLPLIFLLLLATSFGSGSFHPAAAGIISHLSKKRKGTYFSIFQTFGALGIGVSPFIFAWFYLNFDGKTLLLSIPSVCLTGLVGFLYLKPFQNHYRKNELPLGIKSFRLFFSRRDLTTLFISLTCNQIVYWSLLFLLPDILYDRNYDDWITFGGGHFFLIIGLVILGIPAGWLADRYSYRSVILIANIVSILGLYSFLFAPSLSPFMLLTTLFITGAAFGVVSPLSIGFGNSLMPQYPGIVSSFLMGVVWCLSEGLGPTCSGLLTKCFVINGPGNAMEIVGICSALAFAMTLKLPTQISEDIPDFSIAEAITNHE